MNKLFTWTKGGRNQRYNGTVNTWNEICTMLMLRGAFPSSLISSLDTGNAYSARVIGTEGVADVATPPRRLNRI